MPFSIATLRPGLSKNTELFGLTSLLHFGNQVARLRGFVSGGYTRDFTQSHGLGSMRHVEYD